MFTCIHWGGGGGNNLTSVIWDGLIASNKQMARPLIMPQLFHVRFIPGSPMKVNVKFSDTQRAASGGEGGMTLTVRTHQNTHG